MMAIFIHKLLSSFCSHRPSAQHLKRDPVIPGRAAPVKPQTYVSNTGQCLKRLADEVGVAAEDYILVQDDIHLPLSKLRSRAGQRWPGAAGRPLRRGNREERPPG
jgi:peptidyl-tRNA hydrolase